MAPKPAPQVANLMGSGLSQSAGHSNDRDSSMGGGGNGQSINGQSEGQSVDEKDLIIGTSALSLGIPLQSSSQGKYAWIPPWVVAGQEPDPRLRDGGGIPSSSLGGSASGFVGSGSGVGVGDGSSGSAVAGGVGAGVGSTALSKNANKSLDDWLDESGSEEDEDEEDNNENSEEGSEEESDESEETDEEDSEDDEDDDDDDNGERTGLMK